MLECYKTIPNNFVHTQALTLESFMEMKKGEVLVSPAGHLFAMGDNELITEVVDVSGDDSEVKEFEFEDIAGTKRVAYFINNLSQDYDIITINGQVPMDTTGIQDMPDDLEFSMFYNMETGVA